MKAKETNHNLIAVRRSLQTRIQVAIFVSFIAVLGACVYLGANKIRQLSQLQMRHEAELLIHTLEAGLGDAVTSGDYAAAQAYIDSLVGVRNMNDIEINLIMRDKDGVRIVASNAPTNIEDADDEDVEELIQVLASGEALFRLDRVDPLEDEEDVRSHTDPAHPDFHFPVGSRFLSLTTPVYVDGKGAGALNVVMSLHFLDVALTGLTLSSLTAMGVGCFVLGVLLVPFLARSIFRPLNALARSMYAFGMGNDSGVLMPVERRDEIGVLTNEFYNMAARIRSAEHMKEELARERAAKERHELESRLRQAQKMEALGTLAGGVAHDFNNMLTPIMGYTELSMSRLPADSDVRQDLDEVLRAAQRAQDLVKQILTFSRQRDAAPEPLEIGAIVKETLRFLRASIPANVEVRQEISCNGTRVLGCPTHLHQVVLNLATNACQAMGEAGGALEVSLAMAPPPIPADVEDQRSEVSASYVRLRVADTGTGIAPEVVDRMFDPYFTTKREGEGTGLGLSMVHGIVKEMGGDIQVSGAAGSGAVFDVFLPVSLGESEAVASAMEMAA